MSINQLGSTKWWLMWRQKNTVYEQRSHQLPASPEKSWPYGHIGRSTRYDDVSSRTQHPEIEAILVLPLKPGTVSQQHESQQPQSGNGPDVQELLNGWSVACSDGGILVSHKKRTSADHGTAWMKLESISNVPCKKPEIKGKYDLSYDSIYMKHPEQAAPQRENSLVVVGVGGREKQSETAYGPRVSFWENTNVLEPDTRDGCTTL